MICRKVRTFLLVVIFSGIALACDPWFSCSPYEANLDEGYHNTTASNLAAINELDTDDSRPFKVAVLSDTHYHFSKLQDAINHINQQGDYSFAIVTGDISENGLKQEFVYFYNVMTNLKIPYLTTIGNHDYLSNGEKIYAQMFGPSNYSFVFNNVKFIVFDNTTFESEKEPDMAWLREEFEDDRAYDHVVPFPRVMEMGSDM